MKKLRIFTMVFAVGCLLVACRKEEKVSPHVNQVSVKENNIEDKPVIEISAPRYDVVLENADLLLYEVMGQEKRVVKSIKIDTSYYPDEDIKELKAGISAYSIEKGFEILENFVN